MKRTLIIGADSMLAREIATQLSAAGETVIRCGRSGAVDVRYDLASLQAPPDAGLGKVDALFVCASSFGSDTWDDCITNALVNTVAPYRIAQWAERLQCPHVVLAGSVSSCPEFAPSSYGLSKAQGEEVMRFACARMNTRLTVVRLPQLCDDDGLCARHQIWFARIIARAAAGEDLRLPAGDMPRNFLHVQDAARVLIGAWRQGIAGAEILTAPQSHPYGEIARIAYEVFAKGGRVVDAPEMKPFRPVRFPVATAAAAALLGERHIPVAETITRIKACGTTARFSQ